MKIKDLRQGMVAVLRNHSVFAVIKGEIYDKHFITEEDDTAIERDTLVDLDTGTYIGLEEYKKDLTHLKDEKLDIVKIYQPIHFGHLISKNPEYINEFLDDDYKLFDRRNKKPIYVYAYLHQRGPGPYCQPKGELGIEFDMDDYKMLLGDYYGVVKYDRELTDEEMDNYDLKFVEVR